MRELERDLPTTTADAAAAPPRLEALAIVGDGRVGGSVAATAARVGLQVRLAGRSDAVDACRDTGAALLCVPDHAIGDLASELAAADLALRLVGHTSGATGLGALAPLAEAGAATFALHPLQTIPDNQTDLSGCPCAVSGSTREAARFARELARRLEMRPFVVAEEHRAAYHAAASIASNFLVTLEESASRLLEASGIEDARELLAPLVLRTAANWAERGPGALTGPIARGDEATVARHLAALRETAPELVDLYEALAARTRALRELDSLPAPMGER